MNWTIRLAQEDDMDAVFDLIHELAAHVGGSHRITNTADNLRKDGFGDQPLFHCLIAESDGLVLGIAFCYYRYSTWTGKTLYLEDLVVRETHRRRGVGRHLFEGVIDWGKENHCGSLSWQVLDMNKEALDFYDQYEVRYDENYLNASLALD